MALAALALLGVVLVALIWIALLRRQVTEQAGIIREKAQREAALEERHRMAREMHDTLAQSFSGLGFQLDALDAQLPAQAEPARRQLETARQMVRYGQEGFRRTLMNLRAQELERACLTEALPDLARQITANTGIELRCEIKCPRLALSEAVESNVLRIGQECLTNAVRHASPKRINLGLTQELTTLRLSIADDGTGFDPHKLNGAPNGHFGWHGVRERAEQIKAEINIDSQPGRGTVITLSVPI
jgi:signal transduction histidine kinase